LAVPILPPSLGGHEFTLYNETYLLASSRRRLNIGMPENLTLYKFLSEQGSFLAGLFALIAGAIAYAAGLIQAKATKDAAKRQTEYLNRKDRLQARCIATAIVPELVEVKGAYERAQLAINDHSAASARGTPITPLSVLLGVQIEIPVFLDRNVDQLYILGEPIGPTLLQLISASIQYNKLVNSIANQSAQLGNSWPNDQTENLRNHLKVIGILIDLAFHEINQIHDINYEGVKDVSTV